jgi:archaellum component FlaG (FlaF/FlaG flagellin family)
MKKVIAAIGIAASVIAILLDIATQLRQGVKRP